jgi:gliding motility-associated-like protein
MKRYVTLKIILVLLFFIPKATYAQIPDPVITATGNQVYCPGTSLSVVQTVSITPDILDPSTTTDAPVYIQIATGYVAGVGKDILTYVGSNPAITATWSESEAKLTLSPSPLAPGGKVLYTDLETAIKNVQFSNPAATPGKRDFSIILGVGNRKLSYLPRNKHYYEYFADPAVTWASANIKAQTKSYYGMQGYLVTITKADEQQVAGNQAPGTGWIGASDATKEGDWKWVTGPEGLANAGAGTLFFQGQGIGGLNIFFTEIGETVPTKFSFWQNGEPNNSNGGTEDYAQIVDPILSGKQGLWNDLNGNNVIGGGSPLYISKGYIVEYGGMPGDPVVVNKATTTMTIPDVIFYPKKTATICAGNTATFTANVLAGTTVYWYDSSGTLLQNDPLKPNFTTPILNANPTIFYSDNGCVSTRQTFTVTVNPNILPTFNAIPAICANASAPVLPSSSTNGFTGTWSPAIVSNTATGTYTFTPNAGQCATTALLTVTVNPNILPTFNAIPAICTNATAPVLPSSSTNGFTGTWNPAIVSNTATGTYTFTPDAGQCATTASVTVTVGSNILPTFNAIPAICTNASAPVLPSSSTNGFTGTWSPAIVSNTATGTYTFTPDAGQCATTATLTVTVNPNILPTFNAIPAICANATAPVLPSSSINGFTGTWSPAIVSNTATGTYTFTPDVGQCATTASLTVTVNPNILPTFSVIPAICANSTAPVLPSSSTNGFTGTWNPAIVSNTATGTYIFTPDAGQCATTASLTVTVNPNIIPTFNAIPAICANASAPVLPSSSTNGFTGTWNPAIVSNTATGTYTFTPNAGQCATTALLTVTVNPNIVPTFNPIPAICTNATAPVLPSSSTNGFTGTWNPAIVSNTATGTYTFTPDAGQCATTASVTVTVGSNILPTFNAIPAICTNASAPVLPSSSTNGFTGTWSPAIVSNTATGTYTFTPDAGQCATTATLTVTVNPNILPTFNAIPAICANATAPVLPSSSINGFTGTWSPAIVSNTATGTYTFTPDVGQCATTASLTVTVNPNILPTFSVIPAICANSTAPVLPSSSTNGFTGTWNPAIVSNTATGTYIFTPDAGQCATTASLTVTVNPNILPTFNAIPAICANASAPVLPSSSTNGFTGTWNPAIVSNTATGTYTFTPNAGQCATTASLTVTVNPNILPTFNAIPAICANATAPVLPSSSTNGFTGTWNPAIVSNTATGTYIFTPNAGGQCVTTASLTVTVNPNVLPTFNAIPAICANAIAPVLPSSSTNGFTGTWSPVVVSNTATGTYIFTPNAGQCATTATLTVTVNPNIIPTFNAIPAICANSTVPVLPSSSTNGFIGTWSPATVSNTATGTYTFTPSAGQCATTALLTVTVNPSILPTFNAIPAICANATAPVLPSSSTNGFTGTWSPAIVSNTATGTYTFTPNAGQCATIASLTVTVDPLPNINLNENKISCSDTPISFTLDAGIQDGSSPNNYTYIWTKDGSVLPDTTPTLDVTVIGVYTVEVTSASGCSQIRTITVNTSKSPIIDSVVVVDLTDVNTITINLKEPGDFQYSLDDSSGYWQDSNVFSNVSGGIHTVYVSDKFGCPSVSKTPITVIGAPKFFTPNNDAYNDYWKVKGLNADDSKSVIYIYDRYGKLLKQWIPAVNQLGWDGTLNGMPLPADDYWYTLKLENGREAKGHFSLKR